MAPDKKDGEEGVRAQLVNMHRDMRRLIDGQARIETAMQTLWQSSVSARELGPILAPEAERDGAHERLAPLSPEDSDPVSANPPKIGQIRSMDLTPRKSGVRREVETKDHGSHQKEEERGKALVRFVKAANPMRASSGSSSHGDLSQMELVPRTYDTRPGGVKKQISGFCRQGSNLNLRRVSAHPGADLSSRWRIPVHPTSSGRVAFDLMSLFVIFYDAIMVPFALAWNLRAEGVLFWIGLSTTSFWIIDSMLSFITGYREDDDLVMELPKIIRHYLGGWFAIDSLTIACDLVELITLLAALESSGGSQTQFVRIARFAKIGRSVRIIAKFRMGLFHRVDELLHHYAGKFGLAAHLSFFVVAVKLVMVIMWMNHVGTCLWYAAGNFAATDTGLTWQRILDEDDSYENFPDRFMYLTGFYWSTVVMFGGEAFMPPSNTAEALFTSFYIVFGALFLSAITSTLAAILVESQMLEQEKTSKLQTLMRFLHQHRVNTLMSISVREQVQKQMKAEARLCAEDVHGTTRLLSRTLQLDLRVHLFRLSFLKSPFLNTCDIMEMATIEQLCYNAVDHIHAPGEEVFAENEAINKAFLCIAGTLRYVQHLHSPEDVGPGQWICEQTFWMHWRSLGTLETVHSSEMLSISTETLEKAVFVHPEVVNFVRLYSKHMWEAVMNAELDDMSDLRTKIDDASIMAVMPHYIREEVSLHVLANFVSGAHRLLSIFDNTRKGKEALEKEIKEGKCHLTLVREGSQHVMLRVVHLVVLRLLSSDGLLCVRVAKWQRGAGRPAVALPATKVQKDEDPDDTLIRLYQEELACIGQGLTVESHEVMVERATSAAYGVDTKYIRRVYRGILEEFEATRNVAIASYTMSYSFGQERTREVCSDAWKVFAMRTNNDNIDVFAWMPEGDFAVLSGDGNGSRGSEFVSNWLLGMGTAEVEAMLDLGTELHAGFLTV